MSGYERCFSDQSILNLLTEWRSFIY